MKLISDIINELVDTKISLTSPLLKTKLLASRVNNDALRNWVNNELNGYEKNDKLPDYRKHTGQLKGTYYNHGALFQNQQIPTTGLDKKMVEIMHSFDIYEGIEPLETYKESDSSGTLEATFGAELTAIIQKNWRDMGNPYLNLMEVKRYASVRIIKQVLGSVRNKLLDFMIAIDEAFDSKTEFEDLRRENKKVEAIMTKTIINTNGDGNVINTGENAKIQAEINITKGDKEELSKYLKSIGLKEEETAELIEIIDEEEPDREKRTFGKRVNEWTSKMLDKALDGSWSVGIGAAGSILAEALGKYYGF